MSKLFSITDNPNFKYINSLTQVEFNTIWNDPMEQKKILTAVHQTFVEILHSPKVFRTICVDTNMLMKEGSYYHSKYITKISYKVARNSITAILSILSDQYGEMVCSFGVEVTSTGTVKYYPILCPEQFDASIIHNKEHDCNMFDILVVYLSKLKNLALADHALMFPGIIFGAPQVSPPTVEQTTEHKTPEKPAIENKNATTVLPKKPAPSAANKPVNKSAK